MNDSNDISRAAPPHQPPPTPDPARLQQVREHILHAHSTELFIKKCIWWVCAGIELVAIFGAMVVMFRTDALAVKLLCVVVALIAHGGMTVVVTWVLLTSLRMDIQRQLKGMELQLADFRTSG